MVNIKMKPEESVICLPEFAGEASVWIEMFPVHSSMISRAGYDAQCEIMDLEYASDGSISRYYNVPEHIWYEFREAEFSQKFLYFCVIGNYIERRM